MKSSVNFLIDQLKGLYLIADNINVRYEYRSITNTHIIEITPKIVFENNIDYITFENILETEFESLYPDEKILFITEGSLTEIKEETYSIIQMN